MNRLPNDRVVVVTGASSGIGRATAIAFARDGARVALAARSADRLQQVEREIRDAGGTAMAVPTDVTKPGDLTSLFRRVCEAWGTVHILVNNAGIGMYAKIEETKPEDLDAVMAVNVKAPLQAIREVLPLLKRQGCGQVINISSTLGRASLPLMGAYCMSKHALEALSEALRIEVKPHGIDVIVVGPGLTSTEFQRNAAVHGLNAVPANDSGRGASPEKVARAIVRASRCRKRHVYLNAEAKLLLWMHSIVPSLTDRVLGSWMKKRTASGPAKNR